MRYRLVRVLHQTFVWRWWGSLIALLTGVRRHPSATFIGTSKRFEIGSGSIFSAMVRIDLATKGRFIAGPNVWFAPGVEVETNHVVEIGKGTTIQRRSSINGNVYIGQYCILAPNVFISSGTHPFRTYPALKIREQEQKIARIGDLGALSRPVWIQDDCWLGVNVVICPGVTVGKGSIIGANAVVTRDVAPYSVVGGSPARLIGARLDWRPKYCWSAECRDDQVYLLRGNISSCDIGNCAEVNAKSPFVIVMAADVNILTIEYWADDVCNIKMASQSFVVNKGHNNLEISAEILPLVWGGKQVDIRLDTKSAKAGVTVYIKKINGSRLS